MHLPGKLTAELNKFEYAPYLHSCEQRSPDKFSVVNRVWFSLSWIWLNFDQDEFQFTWINSDTLRICYSVNGAKVTLLTSSIYKHMKRAATQLFKRQSKNRGFFQNYRIFTLI